MDTIDYVTELNMSRTKIANAFGVDKEDIVRLLTQGSAAHAIYETCLAHALEDMVAAPSDSTNFSLENMITNEKFGVRCMHANGVSFAQYSNVGAGRQFSFEDFMTKTNSVTGYFVVDTSTFPNVSVYYIDSNLIITLYSDGLIGRNAYLGRNQFFNLLKLLNEKKAA